MISKGMSVLAATLFAVAASAQQAPPPTEPPPGIELLFARHAPPPLASWRRRLARLCGDAAVTLRAGADEGSFDGAVGELPFRVRFVDAPRGFTPEGLEAIDEDLLPALRAHAAYCTIESTRVGPPADITPDYDVLGKVAASLLRRGTSALMLREYGEWRGIEDGTRAALAGGGVLDAFRPEVGTSLVVFLRKQRVLREAELEKQLGAALEVSFDGDENFVAAREGMAGVKLGEQFCMLTIAARAPIEAERLELRARKMVEDHRALLHVVVFGADEATAEAARRQLVARIVAALWADDCLGVNWHCDATLVPRYDDLVRDLRAADPVKATLGSLSPSVVEPVDEQAMQRAIETARKTWSKAVAHHAGGGELSAKFPFATSKPGGSEHIWVTVTKIDGDTVLGVLGNEPVDVPGLKLGSEVTCQAAELSDWLFFADGEMVGGYTVKVLQQQIGSKADRNGEHK